MNDRRALIFNNVFREMEDMPLDNRPIPVINNNPPPPIVGDDIIDNNELEENIDEENIQDINDEFF